MERHGRAEWHDIDAKVAAAPTCPKLKSYWHFHSCRYDKISRTCSESEHIDACPLPSHQLRNGRLNQMAYSLFLFVRDKNIQDLTRVVQASSPGTIDAMLSLQRSLLLPSTPYKVTIHPDASLSSTR